MMSSTTASDTLSPTSLATNVLSPTSTKACSAISACPATLPLSTATASPTSPATYLIASSSTRTAIPTITPSNTIAQTLLSNNSMVSTSPRPATTIISQKTTPASITLSTQSPANTIVASRSTSTVCSTASTPSSVTTMIASISKAVSTVSTQSPSTNMIANLSTKVNYIVSTIPTAIMMASASTTTASSSLSTIPTTIMIASTLTTTASGVSCTYSPAANMLPTASTTATVSTSLATAMISPAPTTITNSTASTSPVTVMASTSTTAASSIVPTTTNSTVSTTPVTVMTSTSITITSSIVQTTTNSTISTTPVTVMASTSTTTASSIVPTTTKTNSTVSTSPVTVMSSTSMTIASSIVQTTTANSTVSTTPVTVMASTSTTTASSIVPTTTTTNSTVSTSPVTVIASTSTTTASSIVPTTTKTNSTISTSSVTVVASTSTTTASSIVPTTTTNSTVSTSPVTVMAPTSTTTASSIVQTTTANSTVSTTPVTVMASTSTTTASSIVPTTTTTNSTVSTSPVTVIASTSTTTASSIVPTTTKTNSTISTSPVTVMASTSTTTASSIVQTTATNSTVSTSPVTVMASTSTTTASSIVPTTTRTNSTVSTSHVTVVAPTSTTTASSIVPTTRTNSTVSTSPVTVMASTSTTTASSIVPTTTNSTVSTSSGTVMASTSTTTASSIVPTTTTYSTVSTSPVTVMASTSTTTASSIVPTTTTNSTVSTSPVTVMASTSTTTASSIVPTTSAATTVIATTTANTYVTTTTTTQIIPTPDIVVTQEETNFLRLTSLVLKIASRAVRQTFDMHINPNNLNQKLQTEKSKLQKLKEKKVVNSKQWKILYPGHAYVSSRDFDMTLMITILREIGGVNAPSTGWNKSPATADDSEGADLVRIRDCRNMIAHAHTCTINNYSFSNLWKDLSQAVIRLGGQGFTVEVSSMLTSALDESYKDLYRELKSIKSDANPDNIKFKTCLTMSAALEQEQSENNIEEVKKEQEKLKREFNEEVLNSNKQIGAITKSVAHIQDDLTQLKCEMQHKSELPCTLLGKRKERHEESQERNNTMSQRLEIEENDAKLIEVRRRKECIRYIEEEIQDTRNKINGRFVRTRAFDKVMETLKERGQVVIKANPGDGKTTMALYSIYEMMSHLKENNIEVKPIQLNEPSEWKYCIGGNMIAFIDDIFGRYSLSKYDTSKWIKDLPRLICTTKPGTENRNYLLIVVKNEIYEKCPTELKELLNNMFMVDLSYSEFTLSANEARDMVEAYLPEKFKFEKKELWNIIENRLPLGLPQTCSLFQQLGFRRSEFFTQPVEYLRREIDARASSGENSYAVLVLIFLLGGSVGREDMSDLSPNLSVHQKIKQVSDLCQIPLTGTACMEAASTLTGSFLLFNEHSEHYQFLHSSIQDAVGLQLFHNYPAECIKYSSVHLFERIHSYSKKNIENINSLSITSKHFLIIAEKMLFYLRDPDLQSLTILAKSKIWEDREFNEIFQQLYNTCASTIKQFQPPFIAIVAEAGNINLVKTLVSLNIYDQQDQFLSLNAAANSGHEDIASFLFETGILPTSDTLFESIRGDCLSIFEHILTFPIKLKSEEWKIKMPLIWRLINRNKPLIDATKTCRSKLFGIGGTTILHEACELGRSEMVKIILQRFPDLISSRDDLGCNPIHCSAYQGNVDILKLMIESEKGYRYGQEDNNDGCTIMHQVCCSGNIKAFEYLGEKYPDLMNRKNKNSEGILHWAAMHGSFELFQYIMRQYKSTLAAEVKLKNINGATILHLACQAGNIGVVKYIMERFPELQQEVDTYGYSVLHYVCKGTMWDTTTHIKYGGDEETVQYLIDLGMDVNQLTNEQHSIFHVACLNKNEELFRYLHSKFWKDWRAKTDNHRWNLLHCSAHSKNLKFIEYLIDIGIYLLARTERDETILHLASFCGNTDLCKYLSANYPGLLSFETTHGSSVLHYAAEGGNTNVVKLLIENGMDVMRVNTRKETVLHLACLQGKLAVCRHLVNYKPDLLKSKTIDGLSVLHYACQGHSLEVVKFLIQKRVDVNQTTHQNETVLHMALLMKRKDICRFLLTEYCRLKQIKADRNWNVLHYAVEGGEKTCIDLLGAKDEDFLETTQDNETVIHLASLCGSFDICKYLLGIQPNLLNMKTTNGWTVFHCACQNGDLSFVDYLIQEKTMPISQTTKLGQTALHIASLHKNTTLIKHLVELSGDLLKVTDVNNWSALHYACQGGDVETVKLLIGHNLKLEEKTNNGSLGIHIACFSGNVELCRYIFEHFPDFLVSTDNDDWNVFHYTAKGGSIVLMRYLLERVMTKHTNVSPLHLTKDRESIQHIAFAYSNLELCNYLLNKFNELRTVKKLNGETTLHCAARGGNVDIIKTLVETGSEQDLDAVTETGQTILHLAVIHDHTSLSKYLIERFPKLRMIKDSNRWTFVQYAVYRGNAEITEFALKTLDLTQEESLLQLTSLTYNLKLCRYLIQNYPKLILANLTEEWTLHNCAKVEFRNISVETMLIDKSIDVFRISGKQDIVLRVVHAAYICDIKKFFQTDLFYKVSDSNISGPNEEHFFEIVTPTGIIENAYIYICRFPDVDERERLTTEILQSAFLQRKDKICKYLISKYPNLLSSMDSENNNLIMFACSGGSVSMVKYLIEKGVDLRHLNVIQCSCLAVAVASSSLDVVQYLTKKHPVLRNSKDWMGRGILHIAAEHCTEVAMLKTLISAGYNVYERDKSGRTILHLACIENNSTIIEYILKTYPELLNVLDEHGLSLLHFAALYGYPILLKKLLKFDLDPYARTENGDTILHLACESIIVWPQKIFIDMDPLSNTASELGIHTTSRPLRKTELINFLAEEFPDLLKTRNNERHTAIHAAARNDVEFVKLLRRKGMDIFQTTVLSENVLHLAALNGKVDTVKYLLHHYPELVAGKTIIVNKSPLSYARMGESMEVIELLVNFQYEKQIKYLSKLYPESFSRDGVPNFYQAIADRDIIPFEYIQEIDTDFKQRGVDGKCILHLAISSDDQEMCKDITDDISCKQLLEVKDSKGKTPLHVASEKGSIEIFQLLVQHNAMVQCTTSKKETVLHLAAKHKREEMCEYLIKTYPSLLKAKNMEGKTAQYYFWESDDLFLVDLFKKYSEQSCCRFFKYAIKLTLIVALLFNFLFFIILERTNQRD